MHHGHLVAFHKLLHLGKSSKQLKKKKTKHKESKALISGKPGGCGEGESLVSAWICYTNGVLKNTPLCICSFLQIEGTRRNKLLVLETGV